MIDSYTQMLYVIFNKKNAYRTRAIISRGLYIFTPFFTAVYFVERLLLQSIFVQNKKILQFLSLKYAVYNPEQVLMARVRYVI